MSIIINPRGRLVEVDDPQEVQRLLDRGYRIASPERARELRTTASTTELSDDSIYFVAPAPGVGGYAAAGIEIEKQLRLHGFQVERIYRGQKIGLVYNSPIHLRQLQTPVKVLYSMFESDKIPLTWADDCRLADKIFTPSKFAQAAFAARGIESEVLPLGYNDEIFRFEPKHRLPSDIFTFLHFDAFNTRKGWDIVFKAFNQEFRKAEPVRLILKTTRESLPFPIPRSQYPNIEVLRGNYPAPELAKLLHNSDCFVFPSRGEGFGHPPLEALATGTPVIIPNGSGMAEYFNPEYFEEVKIEGERPALYAEYRGQDVGKMIEPSQVDLSHKMRGIFEHSAAAFQKAEAGATWVQKYTFRNTGELLARKIREIQKLPVLKVNNNPKLSIIVLTYNALDFTKRCLQKISQNTREDYELIIIDNASTDETPEFLQTVKGAKIVLNKKNHGVAAGRNQGILRATGEFIVFLDNDTEVGPGWDQRLLSHFQNPEIGIVGHSGNRVLSLNPLKFTHPLEDGVRSGIVDVVAGYCFAFPRSLVDLIGNQLEKMPYPRFWHEDLEFCLRAKKIGKLTLLDKDIPIQHHEHQSMNGDLHDQQNQAGFYENAAFIPKAQAEKNILYFNCDYNGAQATDAYSRILTPLSRELRKLGLLVLINKKIPSGIRSFDLCNAFDIFYQGNRLVYLHQENDRAPQNWQSALRPVDVVIAPSDHLADALNSDKIHRKLPLAGIDFEVFNLKVKPLPDFYPGKFKFLMLGAAQPRKNTMKLIDLFLAEFQNDSDVLLIIKSGGYGQRAAVDEYLAKVKAGDKIVHIFEEWDEKYLARVYRTVALQGAYVHPHRAECFGLPLLEASACGCKLGTTGWGGPKSTLKGICGVTFFSYRLVPSIFHNNPGEPFYAPGESPLWAEPDEGEIRAWLRKTKNEEPLEVNEQGWNYNLLYQKFGYPYLAKRFNTYLDKFREGKIVLEKTPQAK